MREYLDERIDSFRNISLFYKFNLNNEYNENMCCNVL